MARVRRLSDEAVRHIRTADAQAKALAQQFGVSTQTIYDIRRRYRYADVHDSPEVETVLAQQPAEYLREGKWVEFQEYPKMLYNAEGAYKIVHSAEEEAAAAPEWEERGKLTPPPSDTDEAPA